MKDTLSRKLSAVCIGLTAAITAAVPTMAAAPAGELNTVDAQSIQGWAWDSDDYNHVIPIEIVISEISEESSGTPLKTITLSSDHYREDLHETLHDGYHGFETAIDWSQFPQQSFLVSAYGVTDTERVLLGELTYNKEEIAVGPNAAPQDTLQTADEESVITGPEAAAETVSSKKGASLGIFTTTGYCSCDICSKGNKLTYSGTVPQANHTISADLNVYPIGTKLMINDIIYTVEDMGSSVNGNKIDIYYATHEEALEHGMKKEEVFAVIE